MGAFELVPTQEESALQKAPGQIGLGTDVLLRNAQWFTSIRWIIVGIFGVIGLAASLFPLTFSSLGATLSPVRLLILAAILVVSNVFYRIHMRRIQGDISRRAIKINLWLQICVDLLVVTLLVHMIGSTHTPIAFTYLFHVALACIFFRPRESLLVVLLASAFYLLTVVLEVSGLWLPPVYGSTPSVSRQGTILDLAFALSAVFVWIVVWYLVSHLSETVRERDEELSKANELLLLASQEKNQQMLVTTHDLKAPFAGIETNIQVLKYRFWDEISEPVREVVDKIDSRAHMLRERIRDILTLGDLRARSISREELVQVNLKEVIGAVEVELEERASMRKVTLSVRVPSIEVPGDREQFAILFSNLIANAIFYSQEGGRVEIVGERSNGEVCVSIQDHGIGIREDALPHIFDEYFRTNEATRFNKLSTGLGLSIVKQIAQNFDMRIKVASELGKGTEFMVIFKEKSNRGGFSGGKD